MICRYDEYCFIPPLTLLESTPQTGHLLVHPVDAGVIKRKNLSPVLLQPLGSNITPVPERIKKACTTGSHGRYAQGRQRFLGRVVRVMRVHQVQPQKERLLSKTAQPGARLVHDHVRRGITAKYIDRKSTRLNSS